MKHKQYFFKLYLSFFIACSFFVMTAAAYAVTANDGFTSDVNNSVNTIAIEPDGKIIIGGNFTRLGITPRNHIARLNADGTLDASFDPNADNSVNSIAVQPDGKIIIGGNFTSIGLTPRNHTARLNADGTIDTSFDPNANNSVSTIAMQSDGKIIVGGNFTSIGGVGVSSVVRLNADGSLDGSFNPPLSGNINSIALQPDGKIIIGGDSVNRLNTDGTRDVYFYRPQISHINSIALQPDGKIIIGGGTIVRLNTDGTRDMSFYPPPSNRPVSSIAIQTDGQIIMGGDFITVGAVKRNHVARLNTDGSLDTSFDPNANYNVNSIALQTDGNIIIGGDFTRIGVIRINYLARLSADGILEQPFKSGGFRSARSNCSVNSIAIQPDEKIIIGGNFTSIGLTPRNYIARLNASGTLDASFDPNANNPIKCVVIQADGKIVIGGDFTRIGGVGVSSVVRLKEDGSLDGSFNPPSSGGVNSIALQPDGKIIIGGNHIARLNTDGTRDMYFYPPSPHGPVNSIALQADGKIIIGGGFTAVGLRRNHIARLNADGTLDTSFDPNVNQDVNSISVQADGRIIIGGNFTAVSAVARNHIARLNADGTLDTSFDPNANFTVNSLAVQTDGKIIVGGGWTSNIVRLNADGTLDTSFDASVNGLVYSVVLQMDGKVLIGGKFNNVGSVARMDIARLTNTDAAIQELHADATGTMLTWIRGGASYEIDRIVFEQSSDGITWDSLTGTSARIADGWKMTGLSLPQNQNYYVRATGYSRSGYFNGSGSVLESIKLIYLDSTPPDTNITGTPSNPANSSATFTFTSSDTGYTSFECSIDGSAYSPCASPKTYTGLADGSHTFMVRANDWFGNVDQSPANYTWYVVSTMTYSCTVLNLPAPVLAFKGFETFTSDGSSYDRYWLSVTNRLDYPAEMFMPAPYLPPCGLNTNASRTWVDVYNGDTGTRIYGFCSLSSSADLDFIWFALPAGTIGPKTALITMTDRLCNKTYTSNLVTFPSSL